MKQHRTESNVLVDYEEKQTVGELAELLESIAQKLKNQGTFAFVQNDNETIVQPNERVKTEVKYTQKGAKHSIEIEFDWIEGAKAPSKIEIR
ncbi:MAG: amphi-Trp domain-containing protein [Bacillus sp. (in: firmicutes)]